MDGPVLRGRIATNDQRPLPGVRVVLFGGLATRFRGQETTTNAMGEYVFAPLHTGAQGKSDNEGWTLWTGVRLENDEYVSADGQSSWDLNVPIRRDHVEVRDFTMVQGGHLRGTVVDADSGKPAANLGLRIHDDVLDRGGTKFSAYAKTDGDGSFRSEPLFPGTYVIDINDAYFQGKYSYPKLGKATVVSGETTPVNLTTQERPELQDPFLISGVARGGDGELIGYRGGVRIRLLDSTWQLRNRGGGIDGPGNFRLRFGPVERNKVTPEAPFGIGTLDIELTATSPGYRLVKRTPSEPLRITDDPNQRKIVDGVRYIRAGCEVKFELVFEKE